MYCVNAAALHVPEDRSLRDPFLFGGAEIFVLGFAFLPPGESFAECGAGENEGRFFGVFEIRSECDRHEAAEEFPADAARDRRHGE